MGPPDQNSFILEENLAEKISKPGECSVHLFLDRFATAEAWLELPWHPRVMICKVDDDFFAASTKAVAETIARQLFNEKIGHCVY